MNRALIFSDKIYLFISKLENHVGETMDKTDISHFIKKEKLLCNP